MPPPAQNPDIPDPATTGNAAVPPGDQEFDLLAFWIQHGRLIIRLVVVALIAIGAWGAWQFMEYRKRVSSEEALAGAKTPEEFRKLIGDWGGTPAAAIAHLRLADELCKASKPEEAANALRDFLQKYPQHSLRAEATYALGTDLETAGKLDEALATYQRLASIGGKGAFAPLAFIGQARVLDAQGKPEDAQRALETVQQQFPGSPFFEEANEWLEEIKNPAGMKTGGSPRPAPPAPPTPPTPAPMQLSLPPGVQMPPGMTIPPGMLIPPGNKPAAPVPPPPVPVPGLPATPAPAPTGGPTPPVAPPVAPPKPATPTPPIPANALPAPTPPAPPPVAPPPPAPVVPGGAPPSPPQK